MSYCTHCGSAIQATHQYCGKCGERAGDGEIVVHQPTFRRIVPKQSGEGSLRRFGRLFGLDPRIAFLTLIVDMMLNAGDIVSMGMLLPVSIAAGIVLGFIAYRAQINWYGDDKESAKIKAVILGLLTAIPTPLPEILYIPAGIIGLLQNFRRKEPQS